MIGDDSLWLGADLYDDEEAWQAYETKGRRRRRVRWALVCAWWGFGRHDRIARRRLESMSLMELVDLDATLDSLRHEIRRAAEKQNQQPSED